MKLKHLLKVVDENLEILIKEDGELVLGGKAKDIPDYKYFKFVKRKKIKKITEHPVAINCLVIET